MTHGEGSDELVEGQLDGSSLTDSSHKDGVLAEGLDDSPGRELLWVLISSHHDHQGAGVGLWMRSLDGSLNVLHAILSQLLADVAALVGACTAAAGFRLLLRRECRLLHLAER